MKSFLVIFSILVVSEFALSFDVDTDVDFELHESKLIPDIIDDVKGISRLNVTFPSGVTVDLGNKLTPEQTEAQPSVDLDNEVNGFYTLLMTDPGKVIENSMGSPELRSWLVMNIPGNDLSKGDKVVDFLPPAPLKVS
jgi:phosphatidylethanolamine-binding protein